MSYVSDIRALIGHHLLLLAGANVIICNKAGLVLLQLRLDGSWGLPGGMLEPGESLEQTAVREVKEETNLDVHHLQSLAVFSGPEYSFTLKNQDQINVITALYFADAWSGEIVNEPEEGQELAFFPADNLPAKMDVEYRTYLDFFRKHTVYGNPPGKRRV